MQGPDVEKSIAYFESSMRVMRLNVPIPAAVVTLALIFFRTEETGVWTSSHTTLLVAFCASLYSLFLTAVMTQWHMEHILMLRKHDAFGQHELEMPFDYFYPDDQRTPMQSILYFLHRFVFGYVQVRHQAIQDFDMARKLGMKRIAFANLACFASLPIFAVSFLAERYSG